ncbi:hypothetical protein BDZ97DRAFT_1917255 [Flammula alnicola]|nr:hypothetical protein BDZ97DRAFT_1917255 [Flammula alnicola]
MAKAVNAPKWRKQRTLQHGEHCKANTAKREPQVEVRAAAKRSPKIIDGLKYLRTYKHWKSQLHIFHLIVMSSYTPSRTIQRKHNSSPYPSTQASRTSARRARKQYYVGPLSHADPKTCGLARTAAGKVNNKRIETALRRLAGPAPHKQEPRCQHQRSDASVLMCVGNGDSLNAGRYFQKCYKCGPTGGRIHWISAPLDPSFITDNAEIQSWFRIRDEVDSLKGTGHTPTLLRQQQPFPLLSPLSSPTPPSSPTPVRQASTSGAERLNAASNKGNQDLAVLLMFWTEDFKEPLNATIFPRFDSRVRLSDFKIELGAIGVEQIEQVEVFHFGDKEWKIAKWTTPHLVDSHGQLARHDGEQASAGGRCLYADSRRTATRVAVVVVGLIHHCRAASALDANVQPWDFPSPVEFQPSKVESTSPSCMMNTTSNNTLGGNSHGLAGSQRLWKRRAGDTTPTGRLSLLVCGPLYLQRPKIHRLRGGDFGLDEGRGASSRPRRRMHCCLLIASTLPRLTWSAQSTAIRDNRHAWNQQDTTAEVSEPDDVAVVKDEKRWSMRVRGAGEREFGVFERAGDGDLSLASLSSALCGDKAA